MSSLRAPSSGSMLLWAVVAAVPIPTHAQVANCEALRDAIALRFRAGGIALPSLRVVDAGQTGQARVVGTCEQGSKRIVYLPGPAELPQPGATPKSRSAPDAVLTECRDGTVTMGGDCGRR